MSSLKYMAQNGAFYYENYLTIHPELIKEVLKTNFIDVVSYKNLGSASSGNLISKGIVDAAGARQIYSDMFLVVPTSQSGGYQEQYCGDNNGPSARCRSYISSENPTFEFNVVYNGRTGEYSVQVLNTPGIYLWGDSGGCSGTVRTNVGYDVYLIIWNED